jgi:hypothetical protein
MTQKSGGLMRRLAQARREVYGCRVGWRRDIAIGRGGGAVVVKWDIVGGFLLLCRRG